MIDLVIVAIIGIAVAMILWKKIKDHKTGNSGCGCGGCSGCSGCGGGCQSCPPGNLGNK